MSAVALPRPGLSRASLLVLLASSLLSVAFISQLPVALLADAGIDDAWFWLRADTIARGHWMGGYDQLTLAKGAGYPLFLAAVHHLGLSVMTAQALLYCGACLLFGAGLLRTTGRPWLATLLVVALQWHPAAFAWARVLRDAIGAAQLLAVLGATLMFLSAPRAQRRGWRWAGAAGLLLAWSWTTREDLVWTVPGIALLVLFSVPSAWRAAGERRRLAAGLALSALAFGGWIGLVGTVNLVKYGSFATVETRGWAYADALAALQRVRVGEATPFVPVPRRVRDAVYSNSPAFARLRGPLETGAASRWKSAGCAPFPESCGDFAGGWFMWALRDAVDATGSHASAAAAEAAYRQIADEVGRACAEGRLTCAGRMSGLLPDTTTAQWRTLPARLRRVAAMMTWQGVGDGQTSSSGSPAAVRAMWNFLNQPKLPDPAQDLARFGLPPSAEAPMALRWIKYWIGLGYAAVLPWLWAGGALAFAWSAVVGVRRRQIDPLLVVAAAGWCLFASRGVFMALVDMTSFPAIHVHYLQPAYPMLVVAVIASFASLRRGDTAAQPSLPT